MPGPVGFRGGSDSISSIQGGAESLLGGGEVRPFSPGYDPSVDPGAGLWRDPNAATESDSPFGLDDACEDGAPDPEFDQGGEFALDDAWWKKVGLDGPIQMSQVQGLFDALAGKAPLATLNALQAAFDAHVASGGDGALSYRFETPLTTWVVNHNLARLVGVEIMDLAGDEILANVSRITDNQVQITHATPMTGTVVIS